MYKDLKWIRLVPDQPGKGGMKTGIHSFQQASINDTRVVKGFHVWQGAWRLDQGATLYAPQTYSTSIVNWGIHGYVYPNLLEPGSAPSVSLFGAELRPGTGFVYYEYSTGAVRNIHTGTGLPTSTNVPATFLNIGGRCFIFDGAREGYIADNRVPVIHSASDQDLGIEAPVQPLGRRELDPATDPNMSTLGMVYAHYGCEYLNTPNPDSPIGTLVMADTVTPAFFFSGYVYLAGTLMVAGNPVANAKTSNTTAFTVHGTLACTTGSSKAIITGDMSPFNNGAYCGMNLNFNGYSFLITDNFGTPGTILNSAFDIDGVSRVLNAGEVYFRGVYEGPTVTGVPYTVTGCQLRLGNNSLAYIQNSALNTMGYGQATNSDLVQAYITAVDGALNPKPMGNLTLGATTGLQYAYAFYDPETGHISNLSPLFTLPPPFVPLSQADGSVSFPVGQGEISYPDGAKPTFSFPLTAGTDAKRFSHILFFRTVTGGGSTLFPIGSLQPYVGKVHPGSLSTRGSWNPDWMGLPNAYTDAPPSNPVVPVFWTDFSTDDDLLVSGGLIGPQYTNDKPLVTLKGGHEEPGWPYAAAYWDGRLWVVNKQEPDKVAFSCDSVQCPFGIPEESFPATNFLRIPSEDGQATGIKLIAEMLLITTWRWAYTIVGNNESNYRLVRVSTRMGGVTTRMMDDFPSDVQDQPSVIYYLGLDKNVYEWIPGMNANVISREITDQLASTTINPQEAYVHCISAWGRRTVVVSLGPSQSQKCFMFDVEGRRWTQNSPNSPMLAPPYSMTTVYGTSTSVPIDELFCHLAPDLTHLAIYRWIKNDITVVGGGVGAEITTFPMTFDSKKTKKQLVAVNVHSVAPLAPVTYSCQVVVDESTLKTYTSTMAAYVDPLYSVYGPAPLAAVDGLNPQDIVTLQAAFGTSDGSPPTGYRFAVSVLPQTPTANPCTVLAVDIGYKDYSEEGEVDP